MIRFNKEELATVLAALRLFQREYDGCGDGQIRADWPEHFRDNRGRAIGPLGAESIDDLCERINCENSDQINGPKTATSGKKRKCHHPQGGYCPECIAPGLSPTLTREEMEKIDTFAAHWIEGETRLMELVPKLRQLIASQVAADREETRIRNARA